MEDNALQTIDIRRILSLTPVVDEYALGSDFILGEVSGERLGNSRPVLDMLKYPVRFDGYIIFFLRTGHFKVDLNLHTYDIHADSLLVVAPGNIVKLAEYKEDKVAEANLFFVLVSREFMGATHFDFNKVFQDSVRMWNNPCANLGREDLSLAEDYFNLTRKVLLSSQKNKREIVGSLLTSFLYVAINFWTYRPSDSRKAESKPANRLNQIFERFMTLVTEYHTSERGMAFYADKLCLTPKYLSKLVKQASGRSGPDWIDSFVVLEAKNMLKYSDKTIKEIVYALHFPNQSVFYKFFKAHTGMTPSEYRKG